MTQLYLISPPKFELADFRKQLENALSACHPRESGDLKPHVKTPEIPAQGGDDWFIGAFQLRLKEADDAEIKAAIRELLPICRAHDVAFIINDRVDLCADLQLDGVHVGQEDLLSSPPYAGSSSHKHEKNTLPKIPAQGGDDAIRYIRSIIGEDAVLGVTCHASKHLAMEAGEAGADYVAFGAFYPTTSKPKEKLEKWGTPTVDIISDWVTFATIPCVAIGGITPQNAKPLIDAGADFLAVINAVWSNPAGPAAAVRQFQQMVG